MRVVGIYELISFEQSRDGSLAEWLHATDGVPYLQQDTTGGLPLPSSPASLGKPHLPK